MLALINRLPSETPNVKFFIAANIRIHELLSGFSDENVYIVKRMYILRDYPINITKSQ